MVKRLFSLATLNSHQDYISALRGIAALCIIMFHVRTMSHLDSGRVTDIYISHMGMAVPLFFILSAFSLCLSASHRPHDDLTGFYVRRFFRIAPLFYFVTLVFIVLTHFRPSPWLFMTNILFIFNFFTHEACYSGIAPAAWSIGVEMPFYVLFPYIVRTSSTIRRTIWLFLITCLVSYLFRCGINLVVSDGQAQAKALLQYCKFSMITNMPFFILGILTFHLHKRIHDVEIKQLGFMLLIVSLAGCVGLSNTPDDVLLSPFPKRYLFGLFFIPLILSLSMVNNSFIVNKFTVYCGEISYSMYLVHSIVIFNLQGFYSWVYDSVRTAFGSSFMSYLCCLFPTVLAVILFSVITYKLIELPGMRVGRYVIEKIYMPVFTHSVQR